MSVDWNQMTGQIIMHTPDYKYVIFKSQPVFQAQPTTKTSIESENFICIFGI